MAKKNSAAVALGKLGGQKKVAKGFSMMDEDSRKAVARKAAAKSAEVRSAKAKKKGKKTK